MKRKVSMGQHGIPIPGVTRQGLKDIQRLSIPEFRDWLIGYSTEVYNLGIQDTKKALRENFGFGDKRLQKLTECIKVDQEEAMGGMTNE